MILEYDSFLVNKTSATKVRHVGKTSAKKSIKWGCQGDFVAKKTYLDGALCVFIYENIEHLNTHNKLYHGSVVSGTRYALGARLSEEQKMKIVEMHAFGLSHAVIMQEHTKDMQSWPFLVVLSSAIHFYCQWMWEIFVTSGWKSSQKNILPT